MNKFEYIGVPSKMPMQITFLALLLAADKIV